MAAILKIFKIKFRYFFKCVPNFIMISTSVLKIDVFLKKMRRFWTFVYWNFSSNFDARNHALKFWNGFSKHPVYNQCFEVGSDNARWSIDYFSAVSWIFPSYLS